MVTITDVALRRITGGFIVSHSKLTSDEKKETAEDGPCCMPRSKYEEEFFATEEEAGKRISELGKGLEPNRRY